MPINNFETLDMMIHRNKSTQHIKMYNHNNLVFNTKYVFLFLNINQ